MGFVLDSIRLKEIIESPESVSVEWYSPSFSLDDRDGEFSITLFYENGIAPSMSLVLQVSSDNINFADLTDFTQNINDASGSHMWDVEGSGALWARIKVDVAGGSIDVTRILYSGKQRH